LVGPGVPAAGRFVKDEDEREAMWEQQHELASQKMYSLGSDPILNRLLKF